MTELKKLAEAARDEAPGRWEAFFAETIHVFCGGNEMNIVCEVGGEDEEGVAVLANYIAAADPQTLLGLIERVERMEKALRKIATPALGGKEQQWIAQEALKEPSP